MAWQAKDDDPFDKDLDTLEDDLTFSDDDEDDEDDTPWFPYADEDDPVDLDSLDGSDD